MRTVAASEFSRNFGRYQDLAIREPIRVTSHGRVVGAYISAEELERYEDFRRHRPESLIVGELPDDVVAAIEAAQGKLEGLLREGVASGDAQPLDDAEWASIRREVEEGIEKPVRRKG